MKRNLNAYLFMACEALMDAIMLQLFIFTPRIFYNILIQKDFLFSTMIIPFNPFLLFSCKSLLKISLNNFLILNQELLAILIMMKNLINLNFSSFLYYYLKLILYLLSLMWIFTYCLFHEILIQHLIKFMKILHRVSLQLIIIKVKHDNIILVGTILLQALYQSQNFLLEFSFISIIIIFIITLFIIIIIILFIIMVLIFIIALFIRFIIIIIKFLIILFIYQHLLINLHYNLICLVQYQFFIHQELFKD